MKLYFSEFSPKLKFCTGFTLVFFLLSGSLTLRAQQISEFGFIPSGQIPVKVDGIELKASWAGGLNNAQFGTIDLNGDGFSDLLVFDRHGDRILPFLFTTQPTPAYNYRPEYRRCFPPLTQWMQCHDYNNDGFSDLFTYTPGGIMVYKNLKTIPPTFEKAVDPFITSLQGSIFTNLLVTYVDYPAIADLDQDGDLDILTFWGLGSFVEMHRNKSMELYGNADSLVFYKENNCWGRFAENAESNAITFDTCVDFTSHFNPVKNGPKHTGSTFFLADADGDGIKDLFLGDVDFPDLAGLHNAGTNADAIMDRKLDPWPAGNPVDLWSFPVVTQLDLFNDGNADVLVSSFDPGLNWSQGISSVWQYSNCDNGTGPGSCELVSQSFLQEDMVDLGLGAAPVLEDVNGDGLTDMVIGNYGEYDTCYINETGQLKCFYSGRLWLFINTGTNTNPVFELSNSDFGQLSSLGLTGLFPAFFDFDNDGDDDLFVGTADGIILQLENIAGGGVLPEFAQPPVIMPGIDAGDFATPAFADVDNDGLMDLISGNQAGKLVYYHNQGSSGSPDYVWITDNFGNVNVTDPAISYTGYSTPCLFKNKFGDLCLLAGSESGLIKYYKPVTSEPEAEFLLIDNHFMYISEGIRTVPALHDLNSDGYPELIVGNYCGGVSLYMGTTPGPAGIISKKDQSKAPVVYPNPSNGDFNVKTYGNEPWHIRLFSSDGRLVTACTVPGSINQSLNTMNLAPGIYIAELIQAKSHQVYRIKLIKGR